MHLVGNHKSADASFTFDNLRCCETRGHGETDPGCMCTFYIFPSSIKSKAEIIEALLFFYLFSRETKVLLTVHRKFTPPSVEM